MSRVLTPEELANITVADLQRTDNGCEPLRSNPIKSRPFGYWSGVYRNLRPVVIDGLLRQGEVMNLIASPKVGKSWLSYSLALSVVTGRDWLDTFACDSGRVLILDNELHTETICHRIPVVADAMGIPRAQYENDLHVIPLRGKQISLNDLHRVFDAFDDDGFQLVIGDAWYRFIPPNISENDNAQVMSLYNQLDSYVRDAGCSWVGIHHTSKGLQGEKNVVDVGAGAGSQARAADTHVVLRPHEDDGIVVMESAVRSFKPQPPLALRWAFPVWIPDGGADPSRLKGKLSKGEQRAAENDQAGSKLIVQALREGPATPRVIRAKTKLSKDRCTKLLDRLEVDGTVSKTTIIKRGNDTHEYQLTDVVDE